MILSNAVPLTAVSKLQAFINQMVFYIPYVVHFIAQYNFYIIISNIFCPLSSILFNTKFVVVQAMVSVLL